MKRLGLCLLTVLLACGQAQAAVIIGGGSTGGGSGAPTTSTYWVGAADGGLDAEINLGALGTGLVINTAGTPSIYAGQTCTNQVVRVLGASGAATCATITSAFVDSSIALTASTLAQFAATTSAQLAGVLSDESGSGGGFLRATGPTIDSAVLTTKVNIPYGTALPGSPSAGDVFIVTDDSVAGACDSAAGSARTICRYNGSAWQSIGDGGAGSGDVTAAAAFAADNVMIRSDGTGKGVQATGISVSDTNDVTGVTSISIGNGTAAGLVTLKEGTVVSAGTNAGEHNLGFDSSDSLLKSRENAGSLVTYYSTANPQTTITGNAGTATALAANPTDCSANNFATTIAANGDLTCAQPSISAGVSGLGTGVATMLGNNANATGGPMSPDGTATLTNKSLDCAGTGNTCTIKQEHYFEVAACSGTTAGHIWNAPTSNAAAPGCDTNSNVWTAYLAYDATTDESVHGSFRLPTGYTGGIDWIFRYKMASATSGAVGWCVQLVRLPTGSAGDPALPAQASGNCVSQTVPGTAGYESEATISGVTCTSCAAGDRVFFRISRDADGGAVTDSATGDAYLVMSGPAYAVGY